MTEPWLTAPLPGFKDDPGAILHSLQPHLAIVEHDIPERRETEQGRRQRRRSAHRGAQKFECSRTHGAAPKPHHFVTGLICNQLIKPHDLIVRYTAARLCGIIKGNLMQETRQLLWWTVQAQNLEPVLKESP